MPWLSWQCLLLVIAANSMPVVVGWLLRERCAWPIDHGAVLRDGERLFGSHKTWRGLLAGVLAGSGIGSTVGTGAVLGALAGAAAIAGDLLSSFAKRRMHARPGAWIPLIDQLPEAVLPLGMLWRAAALDWRQFVGTVAAFTVLDLIAARLVGSSATRHQRRDGPPSGNSAAGA